MTLINRSENLICLLSDIVVDDEFFLGAYQKDAVDKGEPARKHGV